MSDPYLDFLAAKVAVAPTFGFDVTPTDVNPRMKPHCRVLVPWLLQGGRRALFTAFGLHKTVMQLEAVRLAAEHVGGRGLIVCPLGVRQEFTRDAVLRLGWPEPPKFIRRIEEAGKRVEHGLARHAVLRDPYCKAAEREQSMPSLFDTIELDQAA
jgi:hypothetical protein